MRRTVRQFPTIILLFAYAMATFGRSALHSLVHDCSLDEVHVETEQIAHGSCPTIMVVRSNTRIRMNLSQVTTMSTLA